MASSSSTVPTTANRRVALIAHDAQKDALVAFVREHLDYFRNQRLIATESTGARIAGELALAIELVTHGPWGGDLLIGALVVQAQIEAVFFFRDPLTAQPHEPDVTALLRVCDVHRVPLATNIATAQCVVLALQRSRDRTM